ncbi:hypothetical protein Tco_0770403 [Tanacetum coccineum]|uniref:Uncharacterized protein n=1 Tax=Tanacetum coccineum TaxID=301880 RepID=A0ABQ4ZD57_9ASTR
MDHECFNLQNDEFEEELKAQRIKDQEFLDTFKELCDSVIKKQREERERIAKEKEAEELEAERKKKEWDFWEIDISCEMILRNYTDDDSEGDVPPFEEPLDDVSFFPSHEERKFLSMVDELFNLSNDDETFDPGGGEIDVLLNKGENNDLNVLTIRTFLPFVTYPEVLPTSYSTGSEDKVFKPGIFDKDTFKRKSSLTLNVFDPLHPPLMDFHDTKAFSGFIFSLLKIFSKKFFEPGIKNATVFWILEASWFKKLWKDKAIPTISSMGSNLPSHHKWTNEFPHCPCSTCARCGSNLVNGDCFNCSTYSSANNYSPNLYTTPPHFSDYSCHDGEGNTPHDLQDNSCVALCSYCRGSHEDYCCTQLWCENGYPICETCGGYHMDHECFDIRDNDFEEELKEQRIKDQEFLDTFKELCDNVLKMQREERERIAKEKEAEELEAERKKKECLKIENSLPKASTRSRRSRIDPSLKGFKVFCKTISLGEMQRIPEESVSSLKMGDEHLNTQKDSRESSVKYPIPTPRELDVIPDEYYDEDYQKRFDELVKDFLSPTSIYDNISIGYLGTIEIKENDTPITPDIPLREETPRYFYDGSMDNGEDIIPLMRISKETGLPEKIIDKSLSESFVSRMNVCQPIPITPDVPILETVNSLKMGEVHFDTSKDSFESSVRDSFSIPRESNDLSNGVIEDFQNEFKNEKNSNSETIADVPIKDSLLMVDEQINTTPSTESDEIKKSSVEILNPIPRESNDAKECEISIKGNSMESKFKGFKNVFFEQNEEFSSYDESSSKVGNKFDTFKCFSNPLFELDEEIIHAGSGRMLWLRRLRLVIQISEDNSQSIDINTQGTKVLLTLTAFRRISLAISELSIDRTATATTLADGTLALKATIDTIEYTITKASIRSKLRLADASGIIMLPNNEIFEGMGHMGSNSRKPNRPLGKLSSLVERVKTLEVALKRKTKRVLLSDSEEEEIEAQGRKTHNLDPLVSLVQELITPSKTVNRYKRRKSSKESAGTGLDFEEVKSAFEEVNTGGIKVSAGIEEINTGSLDVNTGIDPVTTDSIRVSVPSPDRGRREGKAPMTEEEETQASRKTKEQILQEEAGLAEAIRLDALEKALEKEEVAKQVHLDSLLAQRMAEEQELTEEQKKRKAQESVLGKDLTVEDYAKRMVELNQGTWKLTQLKKLNFEEVKAKFEKLFDDEGTQPTEEKVEEYKDDEPTKKTGKRRKQIARKGFHTHHDKDETKYLDEANEKDNSTSEMIL